MGPKHSQELANGPSPKLHEFSPRPHTVLL